MGQPVAGQQVPEGRYGSRGRARSRPWLRRSLFGLAVLLFLAAAVIGYQNIGSQPIEGKQSAFAVLDDRSVRITTEVRRDEPERPAECVVRARSEDGEEVGRKEVLIPPGENATHRDTVLRTTSKATIGEVYGCSYRVPEYLAAASS